MKFAIKSRWTSSVKFEAEIDCAEGAPTSVKIGLAVKWALRSNAVLSNADLSGAVLSGADLRNAVLRGADLSNAVFRGADLRNADLSGADLRNADLRNADLRNAVLRGADLSNAVFRGAVLRGAVLRGAVLPIIKNIHQEIYAAASQPSALDMGHWHVCDTTHCRGGWVVFLAGQGGKDGEPTVSPDGRLTYPDGHSEAGRVWDGHGAHEAEKTRA